MRSGVVVAALALACAAAPVEGAGAAGRARHGADDFRCELGVADEAWIQDAIDGWAFVAGELQVEADALPWMVLFDPRCVYHVAPRRRPGGTRRVRSPLHHDGRRVPVRASAHDGTITLPDGATVSAAPMAATFVSTHDAPFFALALPAAWRTDPRAAADPRLEERILGAVSHEIVHCLQILDVRDRMREVRRASADVLPERMDDDVVQHAFGGDADFAAAYAAEREALFEAALGEPAELRAGARAALALLDARRARHFPGDLAAWARVEDLFFSMEGVAEWARLRLAMDRDPELDLEAAVAHLRGRDNDWVQDHGLGLVLLVDALVPGWQRRVLGREQAVPTELLREALGG